MGNECFARPKYICDFCRFEKNWPPEVIARAPKIFYFCSPQCWRFNLENSANGTTATEGNHERGSLVHLTERGLQNAVSLDSRLAFFARPLVKLIDYQPSRPNVPAAGTLYEQPAHRTS